MELIKQYEEFKSLWGSELAQKKKKFDFTNIYISEVEKKISRLIKKNIDLKMEMDNFDFDPPTERCPKKLSQQLIIENKMMKEELKEWIFITINPKDDISITDFKNKIDSITKWKCFYKGFYVFEQRGENENEIGKGMHSHIMLCKYNVERKRLIQRLETTFKKYCNQPFINTINVLRKSPQHGQETLDEYMKGQKQDNKLQKVELDKIWRKQNNIEDIYFWDTTTDKSIPKKGADGRVSNGGKREGAGRKKKEIVKDEDKIEWGKNVTLEF